MLNVPKTLPETFNFPCDTVTLINLFKQYSRRAYVSPRLERVIRAIEIELQIRAATALASL